jgi:hypothetical protein
MVPPEGGIRGVFAGSPRTASLFQIIADPEGLLGGPAAGQFEFVLKGHAFSRAVTAAKSIQALSAGGMCLSNCTTPGGPRALPASGRDGYTGVFRGERADPY